jgi:four helix bundle protein
MPTGNYRDFIAWKKAFSLALAIYKVTSDLPDEERHGLTSQLRRAAVSVPSNIAEGEGRKNSSVFRHHLSIAHGSLREIETQILLCAQLGYLHAQLGEKIMAMASEVGRLVAGLSRSLKRATAARV